MNRSLLRDTLEKGFKGPPGHYNENLLKARNERTQENEREAQKNNDAKIKRNFLQRRINDPLKQWYSGEKGVKGIALDTIADQKAYEGPKSHRNRDGFRANRRQRVSNREAAFNPDFKEKYASQDLSVPQILGHKLRRISKKRPRRLSSYMPILGGSRKRTSRKRTNRKRTSLKRTNRKQRRTRKTRGRRRTRKSRGRHQTKRRTKRQTKRQKK